MGGNFPAGKREGRDRRKENQNFNIREYFEREIKISRKLVETLKYLFIIKNKNYH